MTPERWKQIDELVQAGLERQAEDRALFLDQACQGDGELRREVESLIAYQENASGFLETPVIQDTTALVADSNDETLEGRTLAQYHLTRKIGQGGMGEVYLAQDTRLERRVALKSLPDEFTGDEQRLWRFRREARAALALNHPNILTIYDIGEQDGLHYIATEYIEGETLRRRMSGESLDPAQAIDIAVQVASALAAAHDAGVIHRDIKPENIMLRPDGLVKVLDFGLAKMPGASGAGAGTGETTLWQTATEPGMVMGTFTYMAPEQARGASVDARSDIFSLGILLYEMLTGKTPFPGDTSSDVIASILKTEPPPIATYSAEAPVELQRLVGKALRKERDERYQSAKELLSDLKRIRSELEVGARPERSKSVEGRGGEGFEEAGKLAAAVTSGQRPPATSKTEAVSALSSAEIIICEIKRRKRGIAVVSALLLVALGGAGWGLYKLVQKTQTAARNGPAGPAPKIVPFTTFPGSEGFPAFSPDGNQIAFVWNGEGEDNDDIYLKLIGAGTPLRLTSDPAPDSYPTWSPDGRYIAFLRRTDAGCAVYLVPALKGAERKLAEVFAGALGLSYSPDGSQIAAPDKNFSEEGFSIHLVSVETGEKRKLTLPPAGSAGDTHPAFSPDGSQIAFMRVSNSGSVDVYIVATAGGEPRRLTFDNASFGSQGRAMNGLAWTPDGNQIIYVSRVGSSLPALWRVAAAGGAPERVAAVGQNTAHPSISRRGDRLAYSQNLDDLNIWRAELGSQPGHGRPPTRLIASTYFDDSPSYSPDGKRIAFASARSSSYEIWVCQADGSTPEQLTNFGGPLTGTPRWSPDGRQIAFDTRLAGNAEIFVISAEGGKPRRLTDDPSEDIVPSWSRDGRWIYFGSSRSSSLQIWKMPAEGGAARQVTRQAGFEGYESYDGRYFYYKKNGSPIPAGIWRVPADGGDEELFLSDHKAGQWRSWTVAEQGIYFVTGERDGVREVIEFYDFATRKLKTVATPGKPINARTPGLSVSPDGKWILYAQLDQRGRDIFLVENFR